MKRRDLLVATGSVFVGAGCVGNTDSSTDSSPSPSSSSTHSTSPTPQDPPELSISNFSPDTITVSYVIRRQPSGEEVFSEEVTIPSEEEAERSESHHYHSDVYISQAGSPTGGEGHDLEIAVEDGPSASAKNVDDSLDPGDHDGIAVSIYADRIEFAHFE